MHHLALLNLFAVIVMSACFSIFGKEAKALEPIYISFEDRALDLTEIVDIFRQEGRVFQVSTAADTEGIVRRIEVRASDENPSGNWAVFALANITDEQIERVIVAPHYRMVDAGLFWPDLGSKRLVGITPSEGFTLSREESPDADVFRVTLNPGTVITFVAELASDQLPQIYLWEPAAYKETVNSFTLYNGIVLGIAGLLAVFLTNLFIVRWTIMIPATAMLSWAVLTYVGIDFGFLSQLFAITPFELQYWRAGSEVFLAGGLIIFLFTYLNLHNWHINLSYLTLSWLIGLGVLCAVIAIDPSVAAGIARISFATTSVVAIGLIGFLGLNRYDRAVMLVPTWILLICWIAAFYLTITGHVSNDIIQPALGGGLVLIVLLISFTMMQHVFSGGTYQQGLFSDSERKSLALTGSGDIVWDWDVTRDRLTTNPDIAKQLGFSPNDLHGTMRNWLPILHPNDRDGFSTAMDAVLEYQRGRLSHEFRLRASDGHHHWFILKARPVLSATGDVIRCVGTIQDITEQKHSEERLLSNAVRDNLTGLPNQKLFLDRLDTLIMLGKDNKAVLPTVFLIDLDNFKHINQSIGMAAGDTIMLALTRRIRRLIQPQDLMGRLGGDQFGIIVLSEKAPARIAALAEAISEAIKAPLDFAQKELGVTSSMGLLTVVNTEQNAEDVLQDVELAMLHAKRFGGNRIEPFRPAFRSLGLNAQTMGEDLKQAIQRKNIHVVYQPIVRLDNLEIAGFEALLRWEDPKRGNISPTEFIPLAEDNDLIYELGLIALGQAVDDMSDWKQFIGDLPIFMSVNLSSTQLLNSDLYEDIIGVIGRSSCPASRFKLELTESVVMANPDRALATFEKIKSAGIGLSLDDFGTGYSSISYLAQFPFDVIKLDRSIVTAKGEKREKMLRSLVGLAQELDMEVVAEGIETTKDAEFLADLKCEYGQSFLLGAPLNAEDTHKLLKERFGKT